MSSLMRIPAVTEAEQPARDAEQPTLDHELSHDVAVRGAKRTPDRQLSRAAGRAEEQQIAHVDARDEQQQTNRGDQYEENGPDIADHRVRERLDVRTVVRRGPPTGPS